MPLWTEATSNICDHTIMVMTRAVLYLMGLLNVAFSQFRYEEITNANKPCVDIK